MALVGPITNLIGERNFLLFAAAFHILVNVIVYRVPGVKEMRTPVALSGNSSKSEQD
jgi:hypothetical protein